MLKKYWLNQGKVVDNGEGEAQVWVYVDPDEVERRFLIDQMGLDEHNLASVSASARKRASLSSPV